MKTLTHLILAATFLLRTVRSQDCDASIVELATCAAGQGINATECVGCIVSIFGNVPSNTSCLEAEWALCPTVAGCSECSGCEDAAQGVAECSVQASGCSNFECIDDCNDESIALGQCMRTNGMTQDEIHECTECLIAARPPDVTSCTAVESLHCEALENTCTACGDCIREVGEHTGCQYLNSGCTSFECGGGVSASNPTPAPTRSPTPSPVAAGNPSSCSLDDARSQLQTCANAAGTNAAGCLSCMLSVFRSIPSNTSCLEAEWALCPTAAGCEDCVGCEDEVLGVVECTANGAGCTSFDCFDDCNDEAILLGQCMKNNDMTQDELHECAGCLIDARPRDVTSCTVIRGLHCTALQDDCPACNKCMFEIEQNTECQYQNSGCNAGFDCGGTAPEPTFAPVAATFSPTFSPTIAPSSMPSAMPMPVACRDERVTFEQCVDANVIAANVDECAACAGDAISQDHRGCFSFQGPDGVCDRAERCTGACSACMVQMMEMLSCQVAEFYVGCMLEDCPNSPTLFRGGSGEGGTSGTTQLMGGLGAVSVVVTLLLVVSGLVV